MVQVGTPIGYDGSMEDDEKRPSQPEETPVPPQPWSNAVRDAVRDFVAGLSESSRQLAGAAERLAGESLHLIDDVASKAQASASASSDMAGAANRAAEEARQLADSVRESLQEAGQTARTEARRAVEEALDQAREAANSASLLKHDIEAHINDAMQRIQEAMGSGEVAATQARQAAEDARQTADQQRAAIEERLIEATSRLDAIASGAHDAAAGARQAQNDAYEAVQQQRAELLQTVAATVAQAESFGSSVEASAASARTAAAAAEASAELLRVDFDKRIASAIQRVEASAASAQSAASRAERAADSTRTDDDFRNRIEAAIFRLDAGVTAATEAAIGARQAADQAQHLASEAKETAQVLSSNPPPADSGTQQVLERLEADYQLITSLVQELATRVAGTASPAPEAAPGPVEMPIEQPEAWLTMPADDEVLPLAQEMALVPEAPGPEPVVEPAIAEALVGAEPGVRLAGRVMVQMAPVPDFDRLLSLDGALGRMPGIRNVTLADYAQEEVTFRIEVEGALDANAFTRDLSAAAGHRIEVVSAHEDSIALRLVA